MLFKASLVRKKIEKDMVKSRPLEQINTGCVVDEYYII